MNSYSSIDIANYFLNQAKEKGSPLTNLKLQKMVYLAHGFYLALTGDPLLNERIECWTHGPVVSDLYQQFKKFGSGTISAAEAPIVSETRFSDKALKTLQYTWNACENFNGVQLSNWTHVEGSPWYRAMNEKKNFIPDDYIKEYFKKFLSK